MSSKICLLVLFATFASVSCNQTAQSDTSNLQEDESTLIGMMVEKREWPFEECDPDGNNFALAACALEESKEVEDRLDVAVREVKKATRREALDLGVRSDPEDPSRTVYTTNTPENLVTAFDEAQKAWEAWRDAQCEWENIGYEATQAGLRHIEFIHCQTRYDRERISILESFL